KALDTCLAACVSMRFRSRFHRRETRRNIRGLANAFPRFNDALGSWYQFLVVPNIAFLRNPGVAS
ncbi:hypothetical protein, partial [Caballeronia sp. M23-90]